MNRVKRNKKNMVQSFILHVKDSLLWSQQGTKCHDIAAAVINQSEFLSCKSQNFIYKLSYIVHLKR